MSDYCAKGASLISEKIFVAAEQVLVFLCRVGCAGHEDAVVLDPQLLRGLAEAYIDGIHAGAVIVISGGRELFLPLGDELLRHHFGVDDVGIDIGKHIIAFNNAGSCADTAQAVTVK